MRTRAERRLLRQRVIARRPRLTRTTFASPSDLSATPGRLAKWNFVNRYESDWAREPPSA